MIVTLTSSATEAESKATAADFAACKDWIAHHSKSFYLSSLLLPRAVRREAWALYAFCRRADDAVDTVDPGSEGRWRVEALRRRLCRVYEGRVGGGSDEAVDRAFAAVVRRAGIHQELPHRLLAGMDMDAEGTRYHSWDDLLRYCFNVAATVGLMMTAVMGYRAPESMRGAVMLRAADLGVAMQLTNIARDVGEDGRRGRVYLPDEVLQACRSSREEVLALAQRGEPPTEGVQKALRQILDRAQAHYQAADAGIPLLPRGCQLGIRSARLIYAAIGDQVIRRGLDSITERAVVPLYGKLWRVLRALVAGEGWHRRKPRNCELSPSPPGPADPLLLTLCGEVKVLTGRADRI